MVTVRINTDIPLGRKLINELRQHPKVVEFENDSKTDEKTYTVDEVYNQGLDKLSKLYGVDMRKLKSQL